MDRDSGRNFIIGAHEGITSLECGLSTDYSAWVFITRRVVYPLTKQSHATEHINFQEKSQIVNESPAICCQTLDILDFEYLYGCIVQ